MSKKTFSENKYLVIKKSRNGNGIYTKKLFNKGEKIFEVTGTFITCDEDDDIDEETRNNTYRYDSDLFINPKGKVGDFLNHSCNPNAFVKKENKKLFVCALKAISSNREVFIDYSTIIAGDDSWEMLCNCGSKKCRKIVGKFKLLPKEIRERYKGSNIVPNYILEI